MPKLFTSESVSAGHPDKLADSISDSILDAIFEQDPDSRVAVETLVTNGLVQVAGEVRTKASVNIAKVVRNRILDVGYDSSEKSFDGNTCAVNIAISEQSPDIAQGVDNSVEWQEGHHDKFDHIGAGDQGLVFGGAVAENKDFLPTPIHLAHRIIADLQTTRRIGGKFWLYPDAKTQVTIRYSDDGVPEAVETIVLSTQHSEELDIALLREVIENLLEGLLKEYNQEQANNGFPVLDVSNVKYFINPTGRFVIGGPKGDAGLTGRKIIVDTYGGFFRHGGGAFSGKDYTKVDRSAAYAARWVAKNIVAAGLASKAEIQIAYAIGVARPVSISVDTFGSNTVPEKVLEDAVQEVFDLRPAAINAALNLQNVKYLPTSTGGHFGRQASDTAFTWERLDKVQELIDAVKTGRDE